MELENRCISVDWLTMYCECKMIVQNKRWEWRKLDHGTNQFSEVYQVYDKEENQLYCTVERAPYSPIIPKHAMMVQVANRYLYKANWNVELCNFMLASNITPKSISRIDICCDFNEFAYGINPAAFIKKVASGKYRYAGKSEITYQTSRKGQRDFKYMRIGNRESEISSYLYNKTLELEEKYDKPYIREMWKNSGIDTSRTVWRLEVSLSNKQMRGIMESTGEIFRIDLSFLDTQSQVENVYHAAVTKSFHFKYDKKGQRTTRLKTVPLFRSQSTTILLTIPINEAKTNRMDKIIVKRLANYYSMYRIENESDAEKLEMALGVLLKNEALYNHFYEKVLPVLGRYKER